ncbi:MAG: DNA polymerase III, partial [Alicyclobacillus sp.]|nr:DNA polymerase III [Alicyclobacillus sp.]
DFRILPKYDTLVIDEAHHLEQEATRHLGEEVHLSHCLALAARLTRDGGKHGVLAELANRLTGSETPAAGALPAVERLAEQVAALRGCAEEAFAALAAMGPDGEWVYRVDPAEPGGPRAGDRPGGAASSLRSGPDTSPAAPRGSLWDRYVQAVGRMEEILPEVLKDLAWLREAADREPDEELSARMLDACGFAEDLAGQLNVLVRSTRRDDNVVQWVELSGTLQRRQVCLHRTPIDVAGILRERLFGQKRSVILTSATLSVGGNFSFLAEQVGLDGAERDGRLISLTVESPFRYDRQALLCVPNDVPDLARLDAEEAAVWLGESLFQLARLSEGRLLALFTSHRWLQATAAVLRGPLRKAGYATLAQGVDGERTRILESFRRNPRSVLLGAQSFWEGIDLPGDQLRTLVIVRLPFTPPTHPVAAARHERIEQSGRSAFWTASLPEAVVRFKQGFGRLIRTVEDRGVVVVYDKRIVTARYGAHFVRSVGVQPLVAPEQEVFRRIGTFFSADRPSPYPAS